MEMAEMARRDIYLKVPKPWKYCQGCQAQHSPLFQTLKNLTDQKETHDDHSPLMTSFPFCSRDICGLESYSLLLPQVAVVLLFHLMN